MESDIKEGVKMDNLDLMLNELFDEEPSKKAEPTEAAEKSMVLDLDLIDSPKPAAQTSPIREVIKDEPIVQVDIPKPTVNKKTTLENFDGKMMPVETVAVSKPVSASVNIARINSKGDFELIAIAPTKVIDCSETDAKLLTIDHILKTQNIPEQDKQAAYDFELSQKDRLKVLFGTDDVAELNGVADIIPQNIKDMAENLSKELGVEIELTPSLIQAKDETEFLKAYIKEHK